MKKIYFLLFAVLFIVPATYAQGSSDAWLRCYNADSTLVGFKDKNGKLMIQTKYIPSMTIADEFDKIISAVEENDDQWKTYYITKQGRIMGRDSLYFFDNTPDCENEGFIRFKDRDTEKIGIFNSNGDITVPAEYNGLTKVRNGLLVGLKGATKVYYKDSQGNTVDEHFGWENGKELLIDTLNNLLVENFPYNDKLNYYSVEIADKPSADSIRDSFKGVNGKFYSFINYEREAEQVIREYLQKDLTPKRLEEFCFQEVTYWDKDAGWLKLPKKEFVQRYCNQLEENLHKLNIKPNPYFFSLDGLNPFIFDTPLYAKYFDNCGFSNEWKYPTVNLVLDNSDESTRPQTHMHFLRTDDGFKLIMVSF
ncbi:MAG: hypothetical protein ACI35Z_13900 [Sphingobacterium hotanense]